MEVLSDLFYYDATSPSGLRWKVDRYRGRNKRQLFILAHSIAGSFDEDSGYWKVYCNGSVKRCHRIVYALFNSLQDDLEIDHINGVRTDNRIENLRAVKRAVNARNHKKKSNNSSDTTGVSKFVVKNTRGRKTENAYWRADWQGLDGKTKHKNFSISKLGNDEAFKLACEYRAKMIAELNAAGAGYTEDHGIREVSCLQNNVIGMKSLQIT